MTACSAKDSQLLAFNHLPRAFSAKPQDNTPTQTETASVPPLHTMTQAHNHANVTCHLPYPSACADQCLTCETTHENCLTCTPPFENTPICQDLDSTYLLIGDIYLPKTKGNFIHYSFSACYFTCDDCSGPHPIDCVSCKPGL